MTRQDYSDIINAVRIRIRKCNYSARGIARTIGVDPATVSRILNEKQPARMETLIDLCRETNTRITITIEDDAC